MAHYKEWQIKSLAIPALGCGNGGLNWSIVEPLIFKYVKLMDIQVEVYSPLEMSIKKLKKTVL